MAFSGSSSGGSRGVGRRRFHGPPAMSEMNIVPLVDVVLVLLIIFMLTAHVMEFGLEINVPTVKRTSDTTEDFPVISIKRTGQLYLNENPVKLAEIGPAIAKKFPGAKQVFLSGDEGARWGAIAQVISALDEAKLGVKVVVKPEEGTR